MYVCMSVFACSVFFSNEVVKRFGSLKALYKFPKIKWSFSSFQTIPSCLLLLCRTILESSPSRSPQQKTTCIRLPWSKSVLIKGCLDKTALIKVHPDDRLPGQSPSWWKTVLIKVHTEDYLDKTALIKVHTEDYLDKTALIKVHLDERAHSCEEKKKKRRKKYRWNATWTFLPDESSCYYTDEIPPWPISWGERRPWRNAVLMKQHW